MFKRFFVIGAVVLAACGTGSSGSNGSTDPGGGNPPGGPAGGTVSSAGLLTRTEIVKVAVRTTLPTYTAATTSDADGYPTPVLCVAEPSNNCLPYPSTGHPNGLCRNGQCVFVGSSYGNFYVWTDTKANLTAKGIVLPCDNATYTIEVFGATPGTAAVVGPPAVPAVPNEITESWVSTPVTPPLSASTCTITAPTWSSIASPALAIDPIYAGKLAGHLTFTVRASNLAHPWTSNNWSLTYAGQLAGDATQYAGNAAIFPSPLAPPNPMIFTPMYHLDSTLLDSREPLDLPGWKWTDPVVSRAPVGFVSTPTP